MLNLPVLSLFLAMVVVWLIAVRLLGRVVNDWARQRAWVRASMVYIRTPPGATVSALSLIGAIENQLPMPLRLVLWAVFLVNLLLLVLDLWKHPEPTGPHDGL